MQQGLYDPRHERDACGVGFVAHIKGHQSHDMVSQGLKILENLTHRGAVGADPLAGDGAGILLQIPDAFFRAQCAAQGIELPAVGSYGVGMLFLSRDPKNRAASEQILAETIAAEGQQLLGWRDVPVDRSGLGESVKKAEPIMRQVFIARGENCADVDAFERKLFVIRKIVQHAVRRLPGDRGLYIASLSARTIVYKGMLLADQVGKYYLDLQDKSVVSALALVHQRFSTNTFPTWIRAHPFRMIAHNGEINTLRGNVNWMAARHAAMSSKLLGEDLDKLWPLIVEGQSDSACFDNALELLVIGGYSLPHAMMMLIPEAWAGNPLMDEERRAFYEYHAALMEPWDGPAAVAFTDGRMIGATLDRNGLRPARYLITDDDMVLMASEMGVLDIPQHKIVKKWRLQPGKMFLIDMQAGRIVEDDELKSQLAMAKPYRQWIKQSRYFLGDLPEAGSSKGAKNRAPASLLDMQQAFGYSQEDIKFILVPMVNAGEEAIGSMGTDAALPVLSNKNRSFYDYFQQLFAQVTNPPIDPIREEIVMSLTSFVGPKPNLFGIDEDKPTLRLEVHQPVLSNDDIAKLRNIDQLTQGHYRSLVLDMTYPATQGAAGCEKAMQALCDAAVQAVADGYNVLILSDRAVSAQRVAIPALVACSKVHHHLVHGGLRTSTGLVVDTGSAREVHHFALLAGYGAEAVCPWLAYETIVAMDLPAKVDAKQAKKHFIKAINKGLMKVMSKMGISTYQSYCGAQIFEAIGLNAEFVEKYFTGTATQIEGIGLREVAEEAVRTHRNAFGADPVLANALDAGGEYAWRVRGEEHMWTPDTIAKLQNATRTNNAATFKEYARLINEQSTKLKTLRGLFDIKPAGAAVPLEEVEPASEIVKRFATGAMSLGSISTEAHTTLALAMNRIGGKSNTGEGGEDAARYKPFNGGEMLSDIIGKGRIAKDRELKAGDSLRSRIKQVASGRFGVTAEYLASADQIQIKMAQGAKPGEGGQLPGHKVTEYIAKLRFSVPGVGLISPPPHHDIYSIEDLAQLIHDLKNANPSASISVKLVSEVGVGTVAAGVAKTKADHIVISGFDGGTGASPISSIKHAGTPWELGLAEAQQTLVLNQLRGRIALQVDGQLKTGRDVLIGALLGADEFGFATAPLVVEGCIMMRKCHLNTCPVGVATQDHELRKKFTGQPEHVVNFFFFIAEEVREYMAQLGIRKFADLIGRSDLLDVKQGITHWKSQGLDFSRIFHQPDMPASVARRHSEQQDHGLEKALDNTLIAQAQNALNDRKPVTIESGISNVNRTVGAMLSHEVARRYGQMGLPTNTINVKFSGTAGQSFGAFLAHGISFELRGEGNDYVGKGLCGGRIAIMPPRDARIASHENIIVGNTVLYGATSGECYFSGVAGERFAVRNSGAVAVVEGVGDHGCEYMTGGMIIVLGQTGRNFAAGMSGGVAFVLDEDGGFEKRCNLAMVELEPVPEEIAVLDSTDCMPDSHGRVHFNHLNKADEHVLREFIINHCEHTGSARAREILANWAQYLPKFIKVMPTEYRRALQEIAAQQKGAA